MTGYAPAMRQYKVVTLPCNPVLLRIVRGWISSSCTDIWRELGRQVRRGEKAIRLCMPVTVKRTREQAGETDAVDVFTRFIYRPTWFVLAQTDGEPVAQNPIPAWDADRALTTLHVQEIPFDHLDGNCLGFARERSIAINPVNPLPYKARFYELAHVLLGHTTEGQQNDSEITPRSLREC